MSNVTALGAGKLSNLKTQNIIFINMDYKKFYSINLVGGSIC